jgi:hypothetical protein
MKHTRTSYALRSYAMTSTDAHPWAPTCISKSVYVECSALAAADASGKHCTALEEVFSPPSTLYATHGTNPFSCHAFKSMDRFELQL